jgi:hypothetical protein
MSVRFPARAAGLAIALTCFSLSSAAAVLAVDPPTSVSLVADHSVVTVPDGIQLTATVDRHIYGTGYGYRIVDDDGINSWTTCGVSSDTCVKTAGNPWSVNANPPQRHFHAELYNSTGVVARSDTVSVEVRRFVWDVRLAANPLTGVVATQGVTYTATVDRSVSSTGYQIYVVDDDTANSTVCSSGTQCSKTIGRAWADNVNPTPAHVHAEVRRTADTAGMAPQLEAPFRRALFSVDLSFENVPQSDGTSRWRATATTNRSVYGTGYQLKLTRSNGNIVCYASTGTTCAQYVNSGDTYRARVEDSAGNVFGQSIGWTLTSTGPEAAVAGDIDLAALAVTVAGVDVCAAIALSPVRTDVVEPHTSAGDQWEACAAAAAGGAGTLALLVAIANTPGGESNLYWLSGDVTKQAPPPEEVGSADDAKAPRVPPPPLLPDVQRLADELMQKQRISQAVADDVATQCTFLHWRAGANPQGCSSLPIFASGSDVGDATEHDLGALEKVGYVPWLVLNREQSSTKPGDGWQTSGGRCTPTETHACHEYPFFGTEQGGPLASRRGPEPIIGLVVRSDNSLQGTRYSQFISGSQCNMQTGTPDPTGQTNSTGGDPFLSIPLPPEWQRPTLWLCNGKT